MFSLPKTAQANESLDHPEHTGADMQRVIGPFRSEDRAVGSHPGGIRLVLPHKGSRQSLVGPGEKQVQGCLLVARGHADRTFDEWQKLDCQLTDLRELASVRQLPEVVHITAQGIQRWGRAVFFRWSQYGA